VSGGDSGAPDDLTLSPLSSPADKVSAVSGSGYAVRASCNREIPLPDLIQQLHDPCQPSEMQSAMDHLLHNSYHLQMPDDHRQLLPLQVWAMCAAHKTQQCFCQTSHHRQGS
jgi:hypothetical protein